MTECDVIYFSYSTYDKISEKILVHDIYIAITQYGVVIQGDVLIPWHRVIELKWNRDKIDDPFG